MAINEFFFRKKSKHKLRRSREIIRVLIKYGFYRPPKKKISLKKTKKASIHLSRPERLRLALEELGPTFIKLGQILSVRPDLLPLDYIKELEKLQDQVCCSEEVQIDEIFLKNFGKSINDIFILIESTPFADVYKRQINDCLSFGSWDAH